MQNQLLLCVALAAVASTSRVQQVTQHLDEQKETSQGESWSPWELNFEGLSCADLKSNPFGGLTKHWPNVVQKAKDAASDLALKQNCKVCDAKFTGSHIEKDLGRFSSPATQTVTCAATRLGGAACFEGHGAVVSVQGLNDDTAGRVHTPAFACLPCPAGCNSCQAVYNKLTGMYRQFKCITTPIGSANAGGETCKKLEGYECGDCKKRNCGMTGFAFGCSSTDFKSNCKFPETFANSESEFPSDTPSDYSFTLKGGKAKGQLPPVLPFLLAEPST